MTTLTPSQIAQYRDEGYKVAEGATSPGLLATLKAELHGWVEESREHGSGWGDTLSGYDRFDLEPGHTAEYPRLRRSTTRPRFRPRGARRTSRPRSPIWSRT